MNLLLSHEQPHSAAALLRTQKMRQGSLLGLTVAVGVKEHVGQPHMMFCSGVAVLPLVISKPWSFDRFREVRGDTILFPNAAEIAPLLAGKNGIACFRAEVLSKGGVLHWTILPNTLKFQSVEPEKYGLLNKREGQTLAYDALAKSVC